MARRRRTWTELAALPLALGGAALAAAEVGRRLYRDSQLFCPSHEPLRGWDPRGYGIPGDSVEEHRIDTPDAESLHAWYCRTSDPIVSAVFFHGNTGNLTTVADMVPPLLEAGCNVLLFDYRGFGRSSGRPSISGVIDDGITAVRFHERIRPCTRPAILYGFSLGGAIAAQVIRRQPLDALILQSTFTSLPDLVRVLYPRLPLHHLAGNHFDTRRVLRGLEVPLLVLHGSHDEVIPARMARQLHDSCGSATKRLHRVERGLHNDIFERDREGLVTVIRDFVSNVGTGAQTAHRDRLSEPVMRAWRRRLMLRLGRAFRASGQASPGAFHTSS